MAWIRRPRGHILFLVACAGAAISLARAQAHAQPTTPVTRANADPDPNPSARTLAPTPADFANIRYPLETVVGPIRLAATRAYVWNDAASGVQRVVLDSQAKIVLANYSIDARRASLWLRRLGQVQGQEVFQVFGYAEEIGSAKDPVGASSIQTERLPIRAIIRLSEPLELTSPALRNQPPDNEGALGEFLARADEALIRSIRRAIEGDRPEALAVPTFAPRSAWPEPKPKPAPPPKPAPWQAAPAEPFIRPGQVFPPGQVAPPAQPPRTQPPPTQPAPTQPAPAQPAPTQPPRVAPPAQPPTTPTQPTRQPITPPTQSPTQRPTQPPVQPPAQPLPSEADRVPPPPTVAITPAAPAPRASAEPIFAPDGIVTLAAGNITVVSGEEEGSFIAEGNVTVQYVDVKAGRTLEITAQRAVIFLEPGRLTSLVRIPARAIRGIFLEGDVTAGDGRNNVRGPQIYYDIRNNRALMIDAVFWTYDEQRRLPLYVRAKAIRQVSVDEFAAEKATITNTPFFDPELSIGASSVTISRVEKPVPPSLTALFRGERSTETETRTLIDARNVTIRALGVPFFYWPQYAGDPADFTLSDLRVENRSGSGAALKATWNAFTLLGIQRPRGFSAEIQTDYYFERGVGLGANLKWNTPDASGSLLSYAVLSDDGEDLFKPGTRLQRDGDFRGLLLADNRWRIDNHWTLYTELTSISDPAFIDAFYEDLGETRREFTSRIEARRNEENTTFSLQAKGSFDDFIANEYLLQSQGYTVERMPEAAYARIADDILKDYEPGLLTWSSEYRIGRLGLDFDQALASERGLTTNPLAQRALGINANQTIDQRLRAEGYFEDELIRADTRQELSLQAKAGPVNITPFAVARATAYSEDFDTYAARDVDDQRLWASAGVEFSTQIQRVYDELDSRLLDIHRLRHIIEPHLLIWGAGSNVDSRDLPVYDDAIESLADGLLTRVGMTQTFQTQRGGPGRWHSVDLLVLNTDFVFSDADAKDDASPIQRIFTYRPELSEPGDFFVADAALRLTDAASLTGFTVYDFENSTTDTYGMGILIRQPGQYVAIADLRYVDPQDSTYANFGFSYELTSKYSILAGAVYDFDEGGFQTTAVEVRRRFSSLMLGFSISFNEITEETSFGFVIQPYGAGSAARISGIGGQDLVAQNAGELR